MKKVVSILMVTLLILVMSACGNGETQQEENKDQSVTTPDEGDTSQDTSTDTSTEADNEKKEAVTLKYMTFSAAPDHIEDLEGMIEAFESAYPYITVTYETVSYDDYFTKLQSQMAGGVEPDIFELNYETFVTYASKGVLLNMDEQINMDTTYDSMVYNQEALKAFQYDGSQYGLVESFSNVVLFYNKDLFDGAGVAYPEDSWTWEDELEAAQKLTDEEAGIFGTYAPVQFWEFYKTIEQNGGHVLNEEKTESVINSAQNVETLQWMIDKVNKYKVTPSDEQMSGQSDGDMFKAGKVAMLRTGIWMFSSFSDANFQWDIALEPGNTQKAHHFFSNGISISAKSDHPMEAWLFARFMTSSEEATKIRVASNWELPAITDETILNTYLETTPPKSKAVVFEALESLVVPPVIENWNELTDAVGRELDEAKLGRKTPQEALDAAKLEIDQLLK